MMVTETIYNTPEAWDARASEPMSWQAAMWSRHGQETRFRAVLRQLQMLPGDTLLDYGCGTGRLAAFLPEGVEYFGYDWSPEMRQRARKDGRTVLDDLGKQQFHHLVACGPFNLAHNWSVGHTKTALEQLWDRTRMTLAVCLYRGKDDACITYEPAEMVRWAKGLTTRLVVDASYLDNDFLLVMKR